MKHLEINAGFKNDKTNIKVNIILFSFKDNATFILYSPHLEIYGYGNTEEEAKESFEICLGSFLDYTTKKNTFFQELERLGWELKRGTTKKPKKLNPPSWQSLFKKNDQLEEMLNKKSIKTSTKQIAVPA